MKFSFALFASSLTSIWFGAISLVAAQTISDPPQQMLIFGDSLSDAGNLYRLTLRQIPPSPPYANGRFSNGPLWVETVGQQFNLTPTLYTGLPLTSTTWPASGVNFAVGGASSGTVVQPNGVVFPGFPQQINLFLNRYPGQPINPKALFSVWVGANDYLGATPQPASATYQKVGQTLNNISVGLETLIQAGATQMLVFDVPDLGKTPSGRASGNSTYLTRLTGLHNVGLRYRLSLLRQKYPNVKFQYIDIYTLANYVIRNPSAYGLTNVTDSCLNLTTLVPCPNPDEYLYWDDVHPTRRGHEIIAQYVLSLLPSPSVATTNRAPSVALVSKD
jgi:outer membrane lipase/esterase